MYNVRFSEEKSEPVTVEQARAYCKIDVSDDDELLLSLIRSARSAIEEFTGRSLVKRTVECYSDTVEDSITLPYPDHHAITEVKLSGVVSTDYTQKGLTQLVVCPISPELHTSIEVKYSTSGYCPGGITNEILRLVYERYYNRGNTLVGGTQTLPENCYANLMRYCV